MNEVEKARIGEIVRLHNGILNSLKRTLNDAIKIGELLTEQKDLLKHGDFTAWVINSLPFTDRTARNYMRVFQERDRIKSETVSDLTTAYQSLIEHKSKTESISEIKVLDFAGRERDYSEQVRRSIFDADVEWFIYQFPLETPDETIYEDLKDRFKERERVNRIPNTFSREIYENIKFAALMEIEHRVERFELDFDISWDNYFGEKFCNAELKAKSLKQRWAYMCFIKLLQMCVDNEETKRIVYLPTKKYPRGLILYYREMCDN